MKLVRIDRLAPGGAAVELHPRLTVLAGAPPEARRRLLQTVRSLVSESDPECTGTIEVSGVLLALDRETIDQLRLDPLIDPVLTLRSAQAPPQQPPAPPAPVQLPDVEWLSSTVVSERRRTELRAELRGVSSERTRLGEQMEQARQGLDSFSRAALDVCRGQIDALESRRTSLRAEWEQDRAVRSQRRAELEASIDAEERALAEVGHTDPSGVRSAIERLASLIEVPERPDPAAADLADRLSSWAEVVADAAARSAAEESRVADLSGRLLDARAELADAERATRTPTFDPAVIRRLEEVREEIFSADDRSRLAAGRGKRRLQELRAEEAVLLDQLGFDTYSSYIMGIPSVRADMERSERVGHARTLVEDLERELADARVESVAGGARRDGVEELLALLAEAAELVGPEPRPSSAAPMLGAERRNGADPDVEHLLDQAGQAVAQLRNRRIVPPDADDPAVRDAMRQLSSEVGAPLRSRDSDASADPHQLLEVARRWFAGAPERARLAGGHRERIQQLRAELAEVDPADQHEMDVSTWAQVEQELDAALDRLAEAEERVRAHEEAMERLASLRDDELALRERERELLAAISESEAVAPATDGPIAADVVDPRMPPPFTGFGPAPAESAPRGGADDLAWRLVSRLAEQRAVSFAGAVPMVIDGLPGAPTVRDALLDRIASMSDLVQLVVLSDDRAVHDRVGALGTDASVLRLG